MAGTPSSKPAIDRTAPVACDSAAAAIASIRRAAVADRYAAGALAVEWRPLSALAAIADDWRALAARVLEPNVFYEPAFALPAAEVFGRDAGALLVWSGTSPRQLLGLFPARVEPRRYRFKLPVLAGWTHPFAPLGTPLVERETADAVIAAWLAHLADDANLPGLMLLPFLPVDGPFATTLAAILRRAQMPYADLRRHQRALLVPGDDRLFYIEQSLGQHRHKELRRGVRRLGDLGALLFTTATEVADVDAAIADFFRLEQRGWKGRAGTAASQHDEVCRFIAAATGALAAEGRVMIDRMLLDGRAIAATVTLRSGDTAWFWKIVYDETYAQHSPGVILTYAMTEELVDDLTIVRTDSCAAPNHPMIDRVWRERLALADRLIAVRPQAPFGVARRLEGLRNAAIDAAKAIRSRVRG